MQRSVMGKREERYKQTIGAVELYECYFITEDVTDENENPKRKIKCASKEKCVDTSKTQVMKGLMADAFEVLTKKFNE